jgi:hypothetical protein
MTMLKTRFVLTRKFEPPARDTPNGNLVMKKVAIIRLRTLMHAIPKSFGFGDGK